jgi:aspartokinase/homoserine dehydrogenase 1
VFDTYYKLYESGDRVQRIQGSTSGTLGFLLTESGGPAVLGRAARGHGQGLHGARSARGLERAGRRAQALILGRLLGFRGELQDVRSSRLSRPNTCGSPARVPVSSGASSIHGGRSAEAARERSRVLRYLATVTRRKVSVSLAAVEASDSFALSGTDNQIAFTTRRYDRHNPLVIKAPERAWR